MTTAPILLAYDGSPDAERALDWAALEATETCAPVVVLFVEDMRTSGALGAVSLAGAASAAGAAGVAEWDGVGSGTIARSPSQTLDRAGVVLAEHGVAEVRLEHRHGRVVGELLEAAETAAVVVLGSQGHGRTDEAFLGSVSQHVARHARCPVVVVRRPRVSTARRIVVGMDGSPGSSAALAYACQRAERTGESVTAMHGWHVHSPSTDVWSAIPRTLKDEDARRLLLAESVAGAREDHPDVTLDLEAVAVDPATCLTGASASASLVVVGSRGLGFVGGMLLGSVSQAVLHRAHCPVAVVR